MNNLIIENKLNNMLNIHKVIFDKFIMSKNIELNLKHGVKLYYNSFINKRNIEQYYNLPIPLFFNILYKSINNKSEILN